MVLRDSKDKPRENSLSKKAAAASGAARAKKAAAASAKVPSKKAKAKKATS